MTIPADRRTAVTVVGGYLGAGKTTLLNRILAEAPPRTAVLVNDFGSVDIDARLVESSADGVVSLANGCICCSIAEGFAGALDTIASATPRPERMVIEASGVANPAKVAVYASLPGFRLDSIVVVADCERIVATAGDEFVGDVVVDQLVAADLIVLSKIDLVAPATVDAVRAWLDDVAPGRPVVAAVRGSLPLDLVFDRGDAFLGSPPASSEAAGPVSAVDRFESWAFEWDAIVPIESIVQVLADLPDTVLRVKGIVATDGGSRWVAVHRVGGRITHEPAGEWSGGPSRLVAIGHPGAIRPTWRPPTITGIRRL